MAKLTATKVKAITEPGMYGDGGTLFFCVAPGGSKSWIQRITINGKRHDMGLGGWPLTSLAEAREQAFENRKLARSGGDPLALKRRPDVPTFREAVEKVIAIHEPTWKDGGKTAKLWRATLRDYALPKIGHKRVSDITSADVLSVVSAIWNTKHETARKVKRRTGTVLKWAVVQGYRADNPVDALSAALPKADNHKGHFRTIHHSNVTEAVSVVRASGANRSTVLAYEFLTLTAGRSSEVRLARWEEVDLDTRTWTIPSARMKAAREHRVPLSSRALAILNEAKMRFGESGLIFPASGSGAISDATLSKLSRENDIQGTPHGMRAAFRSWCADANISREIAEACLAHTVKGVEGAYQRSDLFKRRRSVMQKWADYVTGAPRADVIPLHG
ncbi:MAG: integrase arm-type DNA-binding domain-containing protein [Nitrospira sp.]|nr:integrase arm-type DNA-binding domain-containing protein [Nitrospira sp.]